MAGLAVPTEQEMEVISEAFERMGVYSEESDTEVIQRLGIKTAGTEELSSSTEVIKKWIRESGIKHLAIHVDLDVLDPKNFALYYLLTLTNRMFSHLLEPCSYLNFCICLRSCLKKLRS